MRARAFAAVLLVSLAVACGDDDGGEGGDIAVVEVVAEGGGGEAYAFDAPDAVPAGPTRLSLTNEGDEDHHAQVFRLADGWTMDDLAAALATGDPAAALEIGTFEGGTGLVGGGGVSKADAVVDLEAGSYALLCFVPDAEGVPHAAGGMVRPLEVTDADERGPLPEPEVEAQLVDNRIELPEVVDGDAVVSVTNTSEIQLHELVILRPDGAAPLDDITAALGGTGPLPATGVGGVQAIGPGASQRLRLDLDPGRYVLLCAVPGADGTPHFATGMLREVRIR